MRFCIIFVLITSLLLTQAQAGLIDFLNGEKTRINITSYEQADIVDHFNIHGVNYSSKTSTYNPKQEFFSSHNTIRSITAEMQYYLRIYNEIGRDINEIKKYGNDARKLLDQLYLDRESLQKHIKELSAYRSSLTESYYFYNNYRYTNIRFRSARLLSYYKKYGIEYPENEDVYYHYDSQKNYYSKSSRQHTDIENSDYIYIY